MKDGSSKDGAEFQILEEPIEILVNLAKKGEIDPWNIDIVEVTDKFLKQLEDREKMDLRILGRTLLYAAILLRMKSNALEEEDQPKLHEEEPFEVEDHLEDYPVPSLPLRRHSNRPVTLQELIAELRKAEVVEQRRFERLQARKGEKKFALEEVFEVAHEEDIQGRVGRLRRTLEEIFRNRRYITLTDLAGGDRSDKMMTYLSLLFLANSKEVWLEQEELFGELYIKAREDAQ